MAAESMSCGVAACKASDFPGNVLAFEGKFSFSNFCEGSLDYIA